MFTHCRTHTFLCVMNMMNIYAWIYIKFSFDCTHAECSDKPPPAVTLLGASHDPRGWWLAEFPASAILTDWSSMCYTPINSSNYQWARLWTLQTEVNKHNRFWGALRGWGGVGINLFTKGLRLALSLTGKVTKSFCFIIMPTQLVQQS